MLGFKEVEQPPAPERRKASSHKGDFGHVLVVAGSRRMMGAAILCSGAASRAGAGLVTLACPKSMQANVLEANPAVMTLPVKETPDGSIALGAWPDIEAFCERVTVIAAGPGLGQNRSTGMLVHRLIERSPLPMVLDADGLNALAAEPDLLLSARGPLVLTPHPGEMARLIGRTVDEVQRDRRGVACSLAERSRAVVVLKGANTVVAADGKVYVNSSGNPHMASGGAGDVLTGMIAGLLAQGIAPFDAARTAVYWHGLAADRAPNAAGPGAITAPDLLDQLRRSASDIDWYNEELELDDDSVFDPDLDADAEEEEANGSW